MVKWFFCQIKEDMFLPGYHHSLRHQRLTGKVLHIVVNLVLRHCVHVLYATEIKEMAVLPVNKRSVLVCYKRHRDCVTRNRRKKRSPLSTRQTKDCIYPCYLHLLESSYGVSKVFCDLKKKFLHLCCHYVQILLPHKSSLSLFKLVQSCQFSMLLLSKLYCFGTTLHGNATSMNGNKILFEVSH